MALRKPKQPDTPVGRRRPTESSTERRPQAFSYHASRSSRDTNVGRDTAPVARDTKKSASRLKPVHWLYIAVAIFVVGALSFQDTAPKIKIVGSSGSRELLQTSAIYEAAAAKLLAESPANRIKALTETAKVSAGMQQQFPELAAVAVRPGLLSTRPTVVIEAVQPALVMTGNGGTFIVDKTGIARVVASQVSEAVRSSLPIVDDQSGLALTAGKPVLPSTEVDFIEQVLAQLKAANISWQQLTLPAGSSELDVKITDQTYFVKFAVRGGADARQQAGTYLAIKDQVSAKSYIDVRVPERAYYQ